MGAMQKAHPALILMTFQRHKHLRYGITLLIGIAGTVFGPNATTSLHVNLPIAFGKILLEDHKIYCSKTTRYEEFRGLHSRYARPTRTCAQEGYTSGMDAGFLIRIMDNPNAQLCANKRRQNNRSDLDALNAPLHVVSFDGFSLSCHYRKPCCPRLSALAISNQFYAAPLAIVLRRTGTPQGGILLRLHSKHFHTRSTCPRLTAPRFKSRLRHSLRQHSSLSWRHIVLVLGAFRNSTTRLSLTRKSQHLGRVSLGRTLRDEVNPPPSLSPPRTLCSRRKGRIGRVAGLGPEVAHQEGRHSRRLHGSHG
ncbi:hypothetical protein C8Q80DRAFT_1152692 [Daedaleopsis nitida]|nr:hypothetical protein C8Q80DRAFT_1152692 [Daedaleopsis nitida]